MSDLKAAPEKHAYLSVTLFGLKSQAGGLDMEKAMIEPQWREDQVSLDENPHMETILTADMGTCVLYANTVMISHLRTAPAGAPKHSWALYAMPDDEAVVGGPADNIEQAQQFARMAYQATCGLIVGRDA